MGRESGQDALFGDLVGDLAHTLPAGQELLDGAAREEAESADPALAAALPRPEMRLRRLATSLSLLTTARRGRGWSVSAGLSLLPVTVGMAVLDREAASRAWRLTVEVEQVSCDPPVHPTA